MLCIFDEYFDGRKQHCITKTHLDCKHCAIHELVSMSVSRILQGEKEKHNNSLGLTLRSAI